MRVENETTRNGCDAYSEQLKNIEQIFSKTLISSRITFALRMYNLRIKLIDCDRKKRNPQPSEIAIY